MEKILIELSIPAAAQTVDVFIPRYCSVFDVLQLLCGAVESLFSGKIIPTKETLLCYENGIPLNINISVAEANIMSGDRLILI